MKFLMHGPTTSFTEFMKPNIEVISMYKVLKLESSSDKVNVNPTDQGPLQTIDRGNAQTTDEEKSLEAAQTIRWTDIRLFTLHKNLLNFLLTATTIGMQRFPLLLLSVNLTLWSLWTFWSIYRPMFKTKLHNFFNILYNVLFGIILLGMYGFIFGAELKESDYGFFEAFSSIQTNLLIIFLAVMILEKLIKMYVACRSKNKK